MASFCHSPHKLQQKKSCSAVGQTTGKILTVFGMNLPGNLTHNLEITEWESHSKMTLSRNRCFLYYLAKGRLDRPVTSHLFRTSGSLSDWWFYSTIHRKKVKVIFFFLHILYSEPIHLAFKALLPGDESDHLRDSCNNGVVVTIKVVLKVPYGETQVGTRTSPVAPN